MDFKEYPNFEVITWAKLKRKGQQNKACKVLKEAFFQSFLCDLQDSDGIKIGTMSKNNYKCIEALFSSFVVDHIKLPTRSQALKEAQYFNKLSSFPPVGFGACDGFYVPVYVVKNDRVHYIDRKGNVSLNVFGMAGATTRFYYIKSDCPGSWHDSVVFKDSFLFKHLTEDNWRPFEGALMFADRNVRHLRT